MKLSLEHLESREVPVTFRLTAGDLVINANPVSGSLVIVSKLGGATEVQWADGLNGPHQAAFFGGVNLLTYHAAAAGWNSFDNTTAINDQFFGSVAPTGGGPGAILDNYMGGTGSDFVVTGQTENTIEVRSLIKGESLVVCDGGFGKIVAVNAPLPLVEGNTTNYVAY